jgi:alpha-beta hydrolase superfamily lysophospholipase
MSTTHDDGTFNADDGVRLHFRRWMGEGTPRAVMALVHGYLEHSGRYGFVGEYFAPRGYAVYAFDHRGHGQSGGPRAYIQRFDDYLRDIARYLELVRAREGTAIPIMLVGHSMGGLISLRYALEHPEMLRAVAVSSPWLGNKHRVSGLKLFAGRILSRIAPGTQLSADLDSKVLSHDPEVVAAHGRDPLVLHKFTARWATEALAAQEWTLANAARMALPCLVMQAMADELSDPASSRAFFERIVHTNKAWKPYEGYYHELFNEVGREAVFRDLEAWLGANL